MRLNARRPRAVAVDRDAGRDRHVADQTLDRDHPSEHAGPESIGSGVGDLQPQCLGHRCQILAECDRMRDAVRSGKAQGPGFTDPCRTGQFDGGRRIDDRLAGVGARCRRDGEGRAVLALHRQHPIAHRRLIVVTAGDLHLQAPGDVGEGFAGRHGVRQRRSTTERH